MQDFRNLTQATRGIRNNNPGNLEENGINWQGKVGDDGRFMIFQNVSYGLRALYMDLLKDYISDKQRTVLDLISEFAPGHENPTDRYVQFVSRALGVAPTQQIMFTRDNFEKLAKAIVQFENGFDQADLISEADYENAWQMLPERYKKKFQAAGEC